MRDMSWFGGSGGDGDQHRVDVELLRRDLANERSEKERLVSVLAKQDGKAVHSLNTSA